MELWVSDFIYGAISTSFVYIACVIDVSMAAELKPTSLRLI